MAYQVLARKWRPQQFASLVGQDHVVQALGNALTQGRLHHAYLFSGTRGVGKTTLARIFAKSLNCELGVTATPCGQCSACQEIEQGNFVDLIEVDAASRTKVEDTREILDNVQYRPTRGRYKVYLIDEVHMLSRHSFNALLKTLEEPPEHIKFLLATTDPQKLPVTILSRCLQFNLKSLSPALISEHLAQVLGHEQLPFDEGALALLAKAANGSMRDALSLTDQAIAHGNGQVLLDNVQAMLGTLDSRYSEKLMAAVVTGDAAEMMAALDAVAMMSPDYSALLADVLVLLHQAAIAQQLPGSQSPAAEQLAGQLSPTQLQLFYQMTLHGRRDLPHCPDPRMALEMTLLRMLAFDIDNTAPPAPRTKPARKPAAVPSARQSATGEAASVSSPEPARAMPPRQAASEVAHPADLAAQQEHVLALAQGQGYQQAPAVTDAQESSPESANIAAQSDAAAAEHTAAPLSPTQAILARRKALREQRQQEGEGTKKPEAAPLASAGLVTKPAEPHPEGAPAQGPLTAPAVPERELSSTSAEVAPVVASVSDHSLQAAEDEAPQSAPYPAVTTALAECDEQDRFWYQCCETLDAGGFIRQLALNAVLIRSDSGWQLLLAPEQRHLARYQQELADALSQAGIYNGPLDITVAQAPPGRESPLAISNRILASCQAHAEAVLAADPRVQHFIEQFDAELVADSVRPIM
ncbi:DNA polymerase III subunit gamma/tau [Gallaecimonas sp. GXIMD1310]|uniref:DNA polymerase III subunit gamma/tau n=1 Tax=Gallaecimonas sp. GXIMD1310 TaxID=3131926 RepID=UPI00324A494A